MDILWLKLFQDGGVFFQCDVLADTREAPVGFQRGGQDIGRGDVGGHAVVAVGANGAVGTYKKWAIENGKKYFSVASGGGTGRTLHPDNMAAGPASYGMTDTMGRMHGDAQFAGSSSVPAHVEMMGLIGAGNNPMVGMTVAVAVAIEEASK